MNNRIVGATLLIAGTTIGAGMLALPMASAHLRFGKSVILLFSLWVYMLLAAIVHVEISKGKGDSLAKIAGRRLGSIGKYLAGGSFLLLFWSLLSAYISGGSSIVQKEIGGFPPLIAFLYTLLFGVFLAPRTKAVDYMNRFLFLIKCTVFVFMVAGLFPFINAVYLTGTETTPPSVLFSAIPIFFTSFGFHGSLPGLIEYLHGNKKRIYFSIGVGSLIPLLVYVIWQTVTLGILGSNFGFGGDVGLFIAELTSKTGHPYLGLLANLFAFLAIATSFLGVTLGVFHYISEWFPKKEKEVFSASGKALLITFAVPLTFSLFYPKGFLFALGFAAIFLSLLAVVIPSLIAIREKGLSPLYKGFILFMLATGLGVIGIEIFGKLAV